jgi:hypothetical protein
MNAYYAKYKKIDRQMEFNPSGYSACTSYLSQIRSQKVIPSPLGLIAHKGAEGTIKANNLLMGKNHGIALSKSMKFFNNT